MVDILLASYCGEKYLKSQLDSLLNQTYKDTKIIIRDDGSTDNSVEIINDYCSRYPDKVFSVTGEPTGSALKNFARLLECSDGDYVMFCDQDDVWLPNKVETTLAAMQTAEGEGKDIPVLVHSDLKVVDGELNVISNSFFDFQKLTPDNTSIPHLLVQNHVTGCTMMINRALKQKCGKIPDDCIMHDWWLALVAAIFGEIVCVYKPTMLYRQHGNNQVGAQAARGFAFIKRKLATLSQVRKNYDATYTQAQLLLEHYGDSLNDQQSEIITTYCKMQKMNKLKKIQTVEKYGFKKATLLRVIGQYFLM